MKLNDFSDEVLRVIDADGELFHDKRNRVHVPLAPQAPLIDTHGHLFLSTEIAPEVCLARAAIAGVAEFIVPVSPRGRDALSAHEILDRLSRWQEAGQKLLDSCIEQGVVLPSFSGETPSATLPMKLRIVAGYHPYEAAYTQDAAAMHELEILLDDERCVGVGEFGLDFGPHSDVPADIQEQAFRAQLRIAHSRHLPVQLHIRDAQGDEKAEAHLWALRILEEEGIPEAGCDLHCFTCGPEVLAPYAERGCYIAFGGAATFSRSDDIRAAVAACPQELLLSETDFPFMAPVPLRGMPCECAMVSWNAACIAEVRHEALGESHEQTYKALYNNACKLFQLG